jgi:NAD(P)-dependent dehydrogenase (short-subunit alcohol dehydrogenase family)
MMATALENNGATVYIVGRRLEVLQNAAAQNSKYGKMYPIQGDITDRSSLLEMVEVVRARHGYVDLLVNNAGIARNLYAHPLPSPNDNPFDLSKPMSPPASPSPDADIPSIKAFQNVLWETGRPDEFAETFQTNVTAVYYTTIAFLDLLYQGNARRQRLACLPTSSSRPRPPYHTSQVLSVSSSGSFRLDSKILSPSYTLSKAACTHLGKLLANLLAPWGIRSNVLAPGVWPSEMTTAPTPSFKLDPLALADSVPLRRTGTEEVCRVHY